ncbi:putative cysteine ligase BshC [Polaribacter pacificus]|uniref:Putative cysteine ligase BshC n=1 Tax=Polaribacter pacificus TaxID=1775173 RepID=A0A917MF16_9FLAO|nr:bacillithiol biosynthesis cysteine-adding enzyme BshC [Polaribacter pacificus]GGH02295.1 putative cysteine ligase BshC [Polaribacter pacificus]
MKVTHLPYQKTGFFSTIMLDYLEQKPSIRPFYNHFSDLKGFELQIEEKKVSYTHHTRTTLVEALKEQYKTVSLSEETQHNITVLAKENTFTVTTGHQLNLFTGPLYFLYKIFSTINLCETLAAKHPDKNFVPIYWMATEDHDFEEINYFNYQGEKIAWNRTDGGAVGQFSTAGMDSVFEEFASKLGASKNASYLKELFSKAYLEHNNLAAATRYLANCLFGTYGLVIVDGDDANLKRLFTPYVQQELLEQISSKVVSASNKALEQEGYPIQVNPREINLFYLSKNNRERIVFEKGLYRVHQTDITFTPEQIENELQEFPERFSPNVIMRPLYQETILPNLGYIGGGGELAYWLQLKDYFTTVKIPFPVLVLRNSVQVISTKQQKKLDRLAITSEELFLKQSELLKQKVIENSDISVDFSKQKDLLKAQFSQLKEVALKTDQSFIGAVNAQEKKQLNGLDALEKRLLRAEKRRQKDLVTSIVALQDNLLPNHGLEERQRNFSEYYEAYGNDLLESLKASLNPLDFNFTILEL